MHKNPIFYPHKKEKSHNYYDGSPDISLNNKQIVFDSKEYGEYNIFIMNIDDAKRKRLTSFSSHSPCWLRDGRIAFFSDKDGQIWSDIYIMEVDGSNIERLTYLDKSMLGMDAY